MLTLPMWSWSPRPYSPTLALPMLTHTHPRAHAHAPAIPRRGMLPCVYTRAYACVHTRVYTRATQGGLSRDRLRGHGAAGGTVHLNRDLEKISTFLPLLP